MKNIRQFIASVMVLLIITLPVCSAVAVSNTAVEVTASTAKITWQTDTQSTGLVSYGKTTSGLSAAASTAGEAASHEVNLNSLEANQYYYYNIQATDSAGSYTSNYMNFTTLLSAPANLRLDSVSQNTVELEWDTVNGAQSYNVYKDSVLFGTTTQRVFETSSLSYKTTYSFTVKAVDKYGRESAASSALSVTTQEQAVTFSFVQAKDIGKTSAVISWQTDRDVNATVRYGTNKATLNMSQSSAKQETAHEFTLKDLNEDTTYYYQIESAQSVSETSYFKTLGDETPVEILNVAVGDISRGTAEISWITNYETQGYVYYSTDDSFSEYYREDSEVVTHNIQLDNLLNGMTYYFKIIANDAESDIYNFTTSETLYDFLDLESVPSLYNDYTLTLKGTTAENARVYVFVNRDANPYAQKMLDVEGTYFEVNVTLNPYAYVDGVKGRNIVEIDSWDADNNKAVKTYTVDVDVGSPILTVNDIPTYINSNKVNISGTTEVGATVGFFIDGKSKGSMYVINESGYFYYQIDVGTTTTNHTISVEAADAAGNIASFEKIIYVDRQDPRLDFYTSFAGTTHYKLFRIDGHTEPNAYITVTNYGEFSGCDDMNFQMKYGECDYLANVYGPGPFQSLEALIDPTSLMVDLLSMGIGWPTSTVAGPDGNFSVIVSLMPGEADQQLVGKNTLVFNVTDEAGNKYDIEKQVKYQPSCIDWMLEKTTTYPLNLYTNDMTAGDVIGSSLFELRYIGGGVPEIGKITVKEDESGGKLVAQGETELGTTESLYYKQSYGGLENSNEYITISSQTVKSTDYNTDSGKVYLYVPVTISKYRGNVDELPEQFGVYLDVYMSYTDGNGDLANCHLYPALSYDIQKPESMTKWLSPTMINQTISMLDDAINITESAVKYLTWTARATTLACGGVIAWNYIKGFEGDNTVEVNSQQCNVNLKNVYAVCDRILCPAIPEPCDEVTPISGYKIGDKTYSATEGAVEYDKQKQINEGIMDNEDIKKKYTTYQQEYGTTSFDEFWTKSQVADKSKGQQTVADIASVHGVGTYQSISAPSKYQTTYEGQTVTIQYFSLEDENTGISERTLETYRDSCPDPTSAKTIILFTGLEKEDSPGFSIGGSKSSQSKSVWCSEKSKDELGPPKDIPGCYNDQCPQYDNVKCTFGKGYGINPAEDLFGSLQCGCVTGAKNHLENWLKIMYGAKKCMQQALIGETTAGYCERLMSYFVCDVLTQIFKHIFSNLSHGTGAISGLFSEDRLENYQENADQISSGLKDRYGNIVTDRMGLSTDSIINKACLAAFTADWTVLEDALDAIVEEVPVAPIASAQATSRPYGFDPFTGKITIAYNLYVGIVPGGETYIEAWMECDKGFEGGEYCSEVNTDKIDLVAKGKVPGYMTQDGFFDQNIMYIDQNSANWYNKLVVQLRYSLGGEIKTDQIIKPITKNGDISMLNCKFSGTTGFDCSVGAEFMDLANGVGGTVQLYSDTQGTQLSPKLNTYYPGNQVSALVKVTNAYPNNFYFRVNNNKEEFEYWAIGGTETGDYRGLQYYLLWLDDGSASSSTGSSALADWKEEIIPNGDKEVGFELPDDFSKITLRLYPYEITDNALDTVQCELSKTSGQYNNQYGIYMNGDFYELNNDAAITDACKKITLPDGDCSKSFNNIKTKYDRVKGDAYKCITENDVLGTNIDKNDVHYIKYVKFSSEVLTGSKSGTFTFELFDAVVDNGDTEITTEYETTSSSASTKTTKINVLADMNEDNRGETKIFSSDQKPKDQEVKLTYSWSKESTTLNVKPVIHFIEPISIIEQDTGYVNAEGSIPIGFTLWDDKQEIDTTSVDTTSIDTTSIDTISIGIVGYDNYQCIAKWKYEKNNLTEDTSTDGKMCGLSATARFIGFAEQKPPFFEFNLENSNIKRTNDAYYDITVFVLDADANQAEPQVRRIRFSDKIDDTYNDMLVCLGSGECNSGFNALADETITEVEQISSASTTSTASKADADLSTIEDTELQTLS